MQADPYMKDYFTMNDPNNYGPLGTKYRMVQTPYNDPFGDPGYGRKVANETYARLPHPQVSGRQLPHGHASINPTFNRRWQGDYEFGGLLQRMHNPSSSRSRYTPTSDIAGLIGYKVGQRSMRKKYERALALHNKEEAERLHYERMQQEQEQNTLSYFMGRDITKPMTPSIDYFMAPKPGPSMAPAPVRLPFGPVFAPTPFGAEETMAPPTPPASTGKPKAAEARKRNISKEKQKPV